MSAGDHILTRHPDGVIGEARHEPLDVPRVERCDMLVHHPRRRSLHAHASETTG
jgi:hypothetical protein